MKTVSVALVLCLNVGVDPPDVVKTSPCARLECWIGEFLHPSTSSSIHFVTSFIYMFRDYLKLNCIRHSLFNKYLLQLCAMVKWNKVSFMYVILCNKEDNAIYIYLKKSEASNVLEVW